ncbi:MAG: hypothetical protein ACJA0N_001611 [Pseudohongiellaceae bacterium]|jgi:hypothetical protein
MKSQTVKQSLAALSLCAIAVTTSASSLNSGKQQTLVEACQSVLTLDIQQTSIEQCTGYLTRYVDDVFTPKNESKVQAILNAKIKRSYSAFEDRAFQTRIGSSWLKQAGDPINEVCALDNHQHNAIC